MSQLDLSSRAYHSILNVARTIADLVGSEGISRNHLLEAIQYLRFGDTDMFWSYACGAAILLAASVIAGVPAPALWTILRSQ
jgi:hypothetical protein